MTDSKDMEVLAAVEHESWAGWTKWMLDELTKELAECSRLKCKWCGGARNCVGFCLDCEGRMVRPHITLDSLPCVQRWRRQMNTPYVSLSEKEKESDRKVVRKKLKVYRNG